MAYHLGVTFYIFIANNFFITKKSRIFAAEFTPYMPCEAVKVWAMT